MNDLKIILLKIKVLPIHIVIRKVIHKILDLIGSKIAKYKALFFSTEVSDEYFIRCLRDEYHQIEWSEWIANRKPISFFFDMEDREKIITIMRQQFQDAISRDIEAAKKIDNHICDLLGSGEIEIGSVVDWQRDYKTGTSWDKKVFFKEIQIIRRDGSDIMFPWQLSAFWHLPTLGKAYWYTGDETYPRLFQRQITDWIDNNPVYFGVNWACNLWVAVRVMNWCWGYCFFKESSEVTSDFWKKFYKSILIQGRFIYDHLEYKEITSNHIIGNLAGLVYLGILFPEFKEAKKWREFGIDGLIEEAGKQIFPEGVDYEVSIPYNRFVLEFLYSCAILAKINKMKLPDEFWELLEKMFEFVSVYLKPDGTAPNIGDNAGNAKAAFLSDYGDWNKIDNHAYLLSIGAVLFNRDDFKRQIDNALYEETVWLLNKMM